MVDLTTPQSELIEVRVWLSPESGGWKLRLAARDGAGRLGAERLRSLLATHKFHTSPPADQDRFGAVVFMAFHDDVWHIRELRNLVSSQPGFRVMSGPA